MPELPEVETTVRGLNKTVKGLKITDVWSDYFLRTSHGHKQNLKNEEYFKRFRREIVGKKIIGSRRIGKNILIDLANNLTVLVHLKMTGHFLYGNFRFDKLANHWHTTETGPLADPFNRFVHLVFSLSNGKFLALSDVRRFAKIVLLEDDEKENIKKLGPDPLSRIDLNKFKSLLLGKSGPIKSVLMDQSVIAGVGNIYSDEALWQSGIHPEEETRNISKRQLRALFESLKSVLQKSLKVGGDSTSDYRQIDGRPGGFQKQHNVYRLKNSPCRKKGCKGIIERKVIRGRSAHFCPVHQKKMIILR